MPQLPQRRRRLVMRPDQPAGVGGAHARVRLGPIDPVASIDGQCHPIDDFRWRGARLGELPGHPPDMNNRMPDRGTHHLAQLKQQVKEAHGQELVFTRFGQSRLLVVTDATPPAAEGAGN